MSRLPRSGGDPHLDPMEPEKSRLTELPTEPLDTLDGVGNDAGRAAYRSVIRRVP